MEEAHLKVKKEKLAVNSELAAADVKVKILKSASTTKQETSVPNATDSSYSDSIDPLIIFLLLLLQNIWFKHCQKCPLTEE